MQILVHKLNCIGFAYVAGFTYFSATTQLKQKSRMKVHIKSKKFQSFVGLFFPLMEIRTPSSDTLLRGIKELATKNTQYTSAKEIQYNFNVNKKMNTLLIKALIQTQQL